MVDKFVDRVAEQPMAGLFSLLMVWAGLALGHSLVVIQHSTNPMGTVDTIELVEC